jgi:predicted nucleic acid-binding protein
MVMMHDNPIFIDTNILIYANNKDSAFCDLARHKLDNLSEIGSTLIISDQVIREYLVIMTRPGFLEKPVSSKSALEDIERMLKEFTIIFPDQNSLENLINLVSKYEIKGKKIHDTAIVSLMFTNGIKDILTHNIDDFKSFQGITIHSL